MKKYILAMMAIVVLVLASCDDEISDLSTKEGDQEEEVVIELIKEQEHNLVLIDNEDLNVTLTDSKHERQESYDYIDVLRLDLNVENKQNL